MVRRSEEYLMQYDGRELPVHVCYGCRDCGSVHHLDCCRTFDGANACQWTQGFMVICDCGVSGPFSESRKGAVDGWNDMIERTL